MAKDLAPDLRPGYLGIAYFLIGIEVVAEELEEPFGQDTDDLPLDTISRNIKRSVREIIRA